MIPAATVNERRIWYACVLYLKVTAVCGECQPPIVLIIMHFYLASIIVVGGIMEKKKKHSIFINILVCILYSGNVNMQRFYLF